MEVGKCNVSRVLEYAAAEPSARIDSLLNFTGLCCPNDRWKRLTSASSTPMVLFRLWLWESFFRPFLHVFETLLRSLWVYRDRADDWHHKQNGRKQTSFHLSRPESLPSSPVMNQNNGFLGVCPEKSSLHFGLVYFGKSELEVIQ